MPRRRECLACGAHTMDVRCSNCGSGRLRVVPMNAVDERERRSADNETGGRDPARSFDVGEGRPAGPRPA